MMLLNGLFFGIGLILAIFVMAAVLEVISKFLE